VQICALLTLTHYAYGQPHTLENEQQQSQCVNAGNPLPGEVIVGMPGEPLNPTLCMTVSTMSALKSTAVNLDIFREVECYSL